MSSSSRYVLTAGMLGATLAISNLASSIPPAALRRPLALIPPQIAGWTAVQEDSVEQRVLDRLRPTSYLARTYARGDARLAVFIAFYGRQRAGESLHSPKHCLPGRGWSITRKDTIPVNLAGRRIEINDYTIQKDGERAIVLYWYQSRRRVVANEFAGKFFQLHDAILEGDTSGSIVRLSLKDVPDASAIAAGFAAKLIREMQECLGST